MNNIRAILILEDGSTFHGNSIGAAGISVGEIVFNTSMTGYQEIITDPSYSDQIITFTYPHIGNTGINDDDMESSKIFAAGIVIRDEEILSNSWRKKGTLKNFLIKHNIIGISNIDTRKLTKILRVKGSQNGCIISGDFNYKLAETKLREFPGLEGQDLAIKVSTQSPYKWHDRSINIFGDNSKSLHKAKYNVIAYDFGVKHNILRLLKDNSCDITVVPADYPVDKIFELKPDGVFLSNGPGDPKACGYAIDNIKILLQKKIPMFGICLGFQLLALALGASTVKMKFGHHGANHPVMNLENKKVFITSQNHGFMVDIETLPENIQTTHISLFDRSLQGFRVKNNFASGFQGHPEASPGPNDIQEIFEQFIRLMEERSNA